MPYKFSKLKRLKPAEVPLIRRDPVDPKARAVAEPIVEAIRTEGEPALRRYAEQFGEITPGAPLVLRRDVELLAAWQATSHEDQATLKRTAARIRAFARAQRATVTECTVPIPGGEAGASRESRVARVAFPTPDGWFVSSFAGPANRAGSAIARLETKAASLCHPASLNAPRSESTC